ncbi:MAG TPA: hypothetical protein VF145_00755 [Chitinophagaceae bacterium]
MMDSSKLLLTLTAICLSFSFANAQDLSTPVGYMEAFSKAHGQMNATYMAYMSAAGHGKRARKVEKLRLKTVETINETRITARGLGAYKGDNSLRESSVEYITLVYHVFNDDYAKIVNMEEIAEQSFDEMQAYLLLQEATSRKLKEAADKMEEAEKAFAKKYDIQLIEGSSELGEKMELTSKLTHYKNQMFLLFFKCNWQDGQLTKAMNNKNVNDIEQARSALLKYAVEGLRDLDSLKHFNGDASLAQSCRQVLTFYRKMAENDAPKLTDFFLKNENFEKIKKAFESKPASKRTQADIDAYNKAVNEINDAANAFNRINEQVNKQKTQVLNNWEDTDKQFTDRNMPHYKG